MVFYYCFTKLFRTLFLVGSSPHIGNFGSSSFLLLLIGIQILVYVLVFGFLRIPLRYSPRSLEIKITTEKSPKSTHICHHLASPSPVHLPIPSHGFLDLVDFLRFFHRVFVETLLSIHAHRPLALDSLFIQRRPIE